MGKTVIETGYRRFEPVGMDEICALCPSTCRTACARILQEDIKGYSKDGSFRPKIEYETIQQKMQQK